jgi:hypothetical protein
VPGARSRSHKGDSVNQEAVHTSYRLGGEGWTLRSFYTSGGLKRFLAYAEEVEIVTLEGFVALANSGKL